MGLLTSDIRGWFESVRPDEKFFTGPNLPKYPKRYVLLTRAQSGGMEMEFALDNPSWQVHVVGPQSRDDRVNDAAEAAEELMMDIDSIILGTPYPMDINGKRVISAQPFGSGPSPLAPDLGGRVHYTATYIFKSPSGYA